MSTPTTSGRYCPSCGTRTSSPYCPKDGVATLERRRLDVEDAGIAVGDIVSGRYRVTGILGRGGFGAVYSAEHTGTQQAVALKMLLASGEASEDEVRRFHREAQVTAQLRHPNTVRVFDVGQTEAGALYLAMELLRGLTLEQALKDRARRGETMRQDEAVEIGVAVLRALSEAHNQGLVHRDLKPANVMLTEIDGEQVVKVLDFGIARQHDSSLTGEGKTLGTPAYMSPEQCRGAAIDGRSDLYSLAIILYRCVAGAPPFADTSPLALIYKHTSEPPPDLRMAAPTPLSDGFVQVVMKALAKRADDRYGDARAMRDALLAVQRGEPLPASTAAFRVGRRGGDTAAELPRVGAGAMDDGTEPELGAQAGTPSSGFRVDGDAVHARTMAMATPRSAQLAASPAADETMTLASAAQTVMDVEATRLAPVGGGGATRTVVTPAALVAASAAPVAAVEVTARPTSARWMVVALLVVAAVCGGAWLVFGGGGAQSVGAVAVGAGGQGAAEDVAVPAAVDGAAPSTAAPAAAEAAAAGAAAAAAVAAAPAARVAAEAEVAAPAAPVAPQAGEVEAGTTDTAAGVAAGFDGAAPSKPAPSVAAAAGAPAPAADAGAPAAAPVAAIPVPPTAKAPHPKPKPKRAKAAAPTKVETYVPD